ncbi:hypothetical protein LCGC14_3154250, partial [marine sediment metagenome]
SIKASMDNSALLRQGWKTLWTNPFYWTRNAIKSFQDIGKTIGGKNVVDEVILTIFKSPNSFTAEDIVEIACHGGILITQRVFEEILNAGAKPSGPGEFTMRAFLNKKIDLTQAEAIQDLISAKNKFALKAASNQLQGCLSNEIKSFQKVLIDIAAILEVSLDFPEEGLDAIETKSLIDNMKNILNSMQKLSDTFEDGKVIKDGVSICIVGSVNVGKSSLMNAILKKDRAIVTDISGRYVFSIWKDGIDIQIARSFDFGQTWTTIVPALGAGTLPQIVTDSSGRYVFAIWVDGTDIQTARSSDFGQTWSASTNLGGGLVPQIVTDNSGRYVFAIWD